MTENRWRLIVLLFVPLLTAQGDQIEMQNGDRYCGAVLSMTPDTVVLQSEILGQLKVPRSKVSTITFGSGNGVTRPAPAMASPAPAPSALTTHSTGDTSDALRQLVGNTNLVQQIRKQFLADAGPEANDKFDELLNGLVTGKLDMNGLRAEAKSAADRLRAMKKDMGGDAGETLDTYLSMLDSFLAQSAPPAAAPATNDAHGTIIIR